MERDIQQTIRPALAENFARQIGEQTSHLARRAFLHLPNQALLMQHEKHIAEPGNLVKRGQASLNPGTWQFKFIREELPDLDWSCKLRNDARHAIIAEKCGFRLLQPRQVFD